MLRKRYSRLSLRTRATGIALAITMLSLLVVAITGIFQIRSLIAAEQHRSADSMALSVSRASELALSVGDTRELSRLANSFLRDENILFIAAYGTGDRPLASAVRNAAAWEAFQAGRLDAESCIVGRHAIEPSIAVDEFASETDLDIGSVSDRPHANAGPVGRVVVGVSTAPALLAQRHQSRLTTCVTVAAALVGSVVLFLTLGTWMRRLERLADASQSMSQGDFSGSILDAREDEIGRLARSFDAMRVAVHERDAQLRQFTDTLQEQVKQRTHDLELALSAAEEASRAKSLFLANMSHELRTPLNGVIGMVDLMLAAQPNVQQRRYCDVAKSSARSLLELINDILDFSKIEAGKLELDAAPFDLHELAEGVAQVLAERAQYKGLELLCAVAHGVPKGACGDAMRLRQVITNLITNAIKFTERGEVVLTAALVDQTDSHAVVKFSVRDSGIGIPKERLGRLFKSFSQVDASTTRKFGGTGLGLAISQRIVGLMGGAIGVESVEGIGSTFWFTARLEKRVAAQPWSRETKADPRGLRVLAVDDNATNREILQAQLTSWSLQAEVAGGAGEAIQMLRDAAIAGQPYRFAILDMHMPDVDGMQLARQIKDDSSTRNTILISLSSIGDLIKPAQREQFGFAACLTKPSLSSQLYNALVDSLNADLHPKSSAAAAHALEAPKASDAIALNGVRVLLAEDNEINRFVASELLQQAGCLCTMAVNGREAVEAALSAEFDVILMDCQMPELDGFGATRQIREAEQATPPLLRRPIIALTANAIKGDRELCLAAGMDDYVTKPIEPGTLFRAIRSCLPQARLRAVDEAREAMPLAAQAQIPEPPAPAAGSTAPPVDVSALTHRCLGNRKIAAKILGKFDGSLKQDIDSLFGSVRSGNAATAAASAHKIKGAAANVSAEGVRRVAAELERLAKADELASAEQYVAELHQELARFREYLATALSELAPSVDTAQATPPSANPA